MNTPSLPPYGWSSLDAPASTSYVAPAIAKILQSKNVATVLDIGCGNGSVAGHLSSLGYNVTAIDPDSQGIALAQEAFPGCSFICANLDLNDDPLSGVTYDAIISTEVIEHLYSPKLLTDYASVHLNTDGIFLVTTPYHGYLKNLLLSLFNLWDAHHTPLWTGGHIKFWSYNTLKTLLSSSSLDTTRFIGLGRIPFLWKSMLLITSKS